MTGRQLFLQPPDAAAFAPFGRFILPPAEAGQRAFYSDSLQAQPPGAAPVFHVNHVRASELPLTVTALERHPHAAQCFAPLDVARYAVLVMPADAEGAPDPAGALAYLVPGTVGVIYHPGVWHMGATVLDRPGHFAVLMWRGGAAPDDVFRTVAPLTLALPGPQRLSPPLATTEVAP